MSHKGYAWPKAKATFVGSQWHIHQRKWLSPPSKGPRHTGNICCWDWPFFRRSFSAHCFCTGGSPDVLLVGKLYRAGKRMVGTAGCRREELAKGRKISVSIVRGMKNCQVKHSCMGRENRPAKPQSRSGGCSGGWTAGSGCGLGKHADQAVPRCPTYPILRWRGPPNDLAGCVEVLGRPFPRSCVRPATRPA